jgi:hypothetical protein
MQVGFSKDKGMFINRFERRHSKILGRYKSFHRWTQFSIL